MTGTTCVIQVETADGKPLADVVVVCVAPDTKAVLKGTTIEGGTERFQTDAAGRFTLPSKDTNLAVVVANNQGFCLTQSRDLISSPRMVVRPWGRIEGRRLNCGQPVEGQRLKYHIAMSFLISPELRETVWVGDAKATTDAEGRFAFEFVPPVDVSIYGKQKHPPEVFVYHQSVAVEPGITSHVVVATQGRTVIGQVELEPGLTDRIEFKALDIGFQPDMDSQDPALWPSIPKEFDTPERRVEWWRAWYRSEAGRRRREMYSRLAGVQVRADGSFVAHFIEPGKYRISCDAEENGRMLARLRERVEIPEPGTESGDQPFDLGTVTLKAAVNLQVGEPAPDFNSVSLDGQPLRLADFRGKFVLLDFWATWCGPCVAETPHLKQVHDAIGKDGRLVMISLSLDANAAEPRKFAQREGIEWVQGFLGSWSNDRVTHAYGVYGIPAIFLIGPDGKVLATDLRGPKIKETVAQQLEAARTHSQDGRAA